MKKSVLFIILAVAFAFASCNSTSNVSSSNTVAKTAGTSCGSSLVNLYKSYKAAGNKVNMNDSNVLTNAIALSTSIAGLKQNGKDTNYRKAYIAGMVLGGAGILTETKAGPIYDGLVTSANALSGINTSSTGSTLTTAANALSTILGLF
ncbi:MAG: hypothetical protein IJK62_05655 [Bacteroidales bacterium]|nr:hypothetical protein [Bacteroidales bacterium]MBQ2076969.1 hypothetical protein [Bacteroidales bacterium]MBQ2352214.1 hypothetical protein [Bacteroidales bacterium]MBQ2572681.1 hypothetical protein [Bacteroidales bacterium]MBQ3833528.1 hypothetical protein [Bacteroidales bacterium]